VVAVGRIAQKNPEQSGNALQASILAGSVMYLRLLALILIINPVFLPILPGDSFCWLPWEVCSPFG
jgi:hypothetical protein